MTIHPSPHSVRRKPRVMLIDLDDTLYISEDVPTVVRRRIQEYMVQHLGFSSETVAAETLNLYVNHGTTLAGLVASGHRIDYVHWHEFVHWGAGAIDYGHAIRPAPELRELLFSIDIPKYILTNADRVHMDKCLELMGISDCFQGFFYFENVMDIGREAGIVCANSVLCKPNPKTYQLVAQRLGVDMAEVMFLDDSVRNVAAAHALGAYTVLVGKDTPCPGANLAVRSMLELPHAMPELFDQPGEVTDPHPHPHGAPQQQAVALQAAQEPAVPMLA